MMTRRTDSAQTCFALRLTGLLAVLAGVIGLHGLANQCVGGMAADTPHAALTASLALSSPNLTPTEVSGSLDPVLAQVHDAAAASVTALGDEGMNLMTGFCLALLVVGIGAPTMLLRRNRVTPVAWLLPHAIGAIERSGRDPTPPVLTALSIQRC